MRRRIKLFMLPNSSLLEAMGGAWFRVVGLPEGSTVLGVSEDFARRAWIVAVEHESFPEVNEGEWAPDADGALIIAPVEHVLQADEEITRDLIDQMPGHSARRVA